MKVLCISASNTKSKGKNSASTKVCEIIKRIIFKEYNKNVEVNVIPLMEYDVQSCALCGKCSDDMKCVSDSDFNKVFSELTKSDRIFIVVPHYSPIPSKLIILFEKMNEILYGGWIKDKNFTSPLSKKTVGIIGHGGMPESEDVLNYYHQHLVTPISRTLESLSLKTIGLNEKFSKGVVFGLRDDTCIKETRDELFPQIIHDWPFIEERIKPLVLNVMTYE
ncbi:flavodoxin family protein [Mycoplasmatota bacterium]|nr:flavodoxin family protein [Mycoplasmatota bacterium]